ncbi:protein DETOXIFICATION 43-like [Macadamia integrifolia]|uniref:protein DETOXIFICATION 43-like n=1 Tax=Macadamia integrifolia TaxID=60698 RepID=UPI001C4EBF3A|nr:protein DETOXIFICATION 43-like [Macadamia integrifolia]
MFVFCLGVNNAALAHVISQYFIAIILLWRLMKHIELLPPSIKDQQFSRFLKNGNHSLTEGVNKNDLNHQKVKLNLIVTF